jgi:hypothetical protein
MWVLAGDQVRQPHPDDPQHADAGKPRPSHDAHGAGFGCMLEPRREREPGARQRVVPRRDHGRLHRPPGQFRREIGEVEGILATIDARQCVLKLRTSEAGVIDVAVAGHDLLEPDRVTSSSV